MREIKFRAWDKIVKKYLKPYPDGFYILGETTCFDLIGMQLGAREPKGHVIEKLNDIEIEQFTGLLDKNGKEIYEGDILKIAAYKSDLDGHIEYEIDSVIFDNYAFCLDNDHEFMALCLDESICEVIGNIHENPELLEEVE